MKLRLLMWLFVAGLLVTGGYVLIDRWIKETEAINRSEIDDWADLQIASALADKLNQPNAPVLAALKETPTSEMATLIDNTVNSVTLTFTKLANRLSIQVMLDISYQDGTDFRAITEQNWDNLPESVRAEFLRGGSNIVSRIWAFPWSIMQTG